VAVLLPPMAVEAKDEPHPATSALTPTALPSLGCRQNQLA
jgi:hypothetical protein